MLDAAVVEPLPDLRARDLRGGGVLHEVVDRRGADTLEPGGDVADPDGDVRTNARLGDLAGRRDDVQQVCRPRRDVLAQPFELVRPIAENGIELGLRDRDEVRVRDPGAVEAVPGFARLVLTDAGQRDLVHLGIAPTRDERGHAADRMRTTSVARAHEKLGVRAHERHRHRHLHAIGEHELGALSELLDDREDVVPASGVETGRVLAELVEDLVHLERREDRLDEDGRLDRPARDPDPVLREAEDVVPEPRLEVALELRQVEVRPRPALEQPLRVAREVDAEVEEPSGDVLAVDLDVALLEMPAARTDEEHRDVVVQRVALLGLTRVRSSVRSRP